MSQERTTKKMNYYNDAFKMYVVSLVGSGRMNKEQARREFGIKGKSAILNWQKKFGTLINKPIPESLMKPETEPSEADRLKACVTELEAELEGAKLRVCAYNTMIDMAENG
jgi:transposase-like protein